jgi:hypothetical protein
MFPDPQKPSTMLLLWEAVVAVVVAWIYPAVVDQGNLVMVEIKDLEVQTTNQQVEKEWKGVEQMILLLVQEWILVKTPLKNQPKLSQHPKLGKDLDQVLVD